MANDYSMRLGVNLKSEFANYKKKTGASQSLILNNLIFELQEKYKENKEDAENFIIEHSYYESETKHNSFRLNENSLCFLNNEFNSIKKTIIIHSLINYFLNLPFNEQKKYIFK